MSLINLTIPVHNEEQNLEKNISEIINYLFKNNFGEKTHIIISNNASNDLTEEIANRLVKENPIKTTHHLTQIKGKGNAIRESWLNYYAQKYMFMDLDLSTDLSHLCQLEKMLDDYPVVIGTRLHKNSEIQRSLKREITSRGYNQLLKLVFNKKFSDAQCGFEGVNRDIVDLIVPRTNSNGYFFDSELLLLAEKEKKIIGEIPVKWVENKRSHITLIKTIPYFIGEIYEFRRTQNYR